jgi:hypothetical protein
LGLSGSTVGVAEGWGGGLAPRYPPCLCNVWTKQLRSEAESGCDTGEERTRGRVWLAVTGGGGERGRGWEK